MQSGSHNAVRYCIAYRGDPKALASDLYGTHIEEIQKLLVLTCTGLIYAKWLPKELLSTNLPGNVEGGTDGSPRMGALHTSVHTFNISLWC